VAGRVKHLYAGCNSAVFANRDLIPHREGTGMANAGAIANVQRRALCIAACEEKIAPTVD